MTAILGPSGAGKSTFLTVLLGKAGGMGSPQGRVLVNGREMQLHSLQAITGFVPQEASAGRGRAVACMPPRTCACMHACHMLACQPCTPTPSRFPLPCPERLPVLRRPHHHSFRMWCTKT